MAKYSDVFIMTVLDFIYSLNNEGFGAASPLYGRNSPSDEFVKKAAKNRLKEIKSCLSYDNVINHFKKDKIEFLKQLISYLEKNEPDFFYTKYEKIAVYRGKISDNLLNGLLE